MIDDNEEFERGAADDLPTWQATETEVGLARAIYEVSPSLLSDAEVQIGHHNTPAIHAEDGSGVWVTAWVWLPRYLKEPEQWEGDSVEGRCEHLREMLSERLLESDGAVEENI